MERFLVYSLMDLLMKTHRLSSGMIRVLVAYQDIRNYNRGVTPLFVSLWRASSVWNAPWTFPRSFLWGGEAVNTLWSFLSKRIQFSESVTIDSSLRTGTEVCLCPLLIMMPPINGRLVSIHTHTHSVESWPPDLRATPDVILFFPLLFFHKSKQNTPHPVLLSHKQMSHSHTVTTTSRFTEPGRERDLH